MERTTPRLPLVTLTASGMVILLSSGSSAQESLLHWDGDHANDNLGSAIASLPDVTGDGIPDVLVGEFSGDCNGTDTGAGHVYSGKDGTTYAVACGVGDGFGQSVAAVGDLDADGVSEYVIGGSAYRSSLDDKAGRVCVYSGRTGALLYQLEGKEQGNIFGFSASGVGDIDGDGVGDLLVGAVGYSFNYPVAEGRVYAFSGATGQEIRRHDGEHEYDEFGWNCAGVGDVDADGVPDYAVTALYDSLGKFGAVYVYSGASGNALYKWVGANQDTWFGNGLDGRLDWNHDGYGDVLVGAPGNLGSDGDVFVYSGKDGTTLATVVGETSGTQFGSSVANVGDMNGDGEPEILVGEPLNSELNHLAGRATLLDGRTLRRLYHFYGSGARDIQFGLHVGGGLDYNGDGIPDVIISEPAGSNQKPKGGRVTVFAGNDLFLQSIPDSATAGDVLEIDTRGGPSGSLAILVLEDLGGSSYFLPLQIAMLDANGEMALNVTVPSGLAGLTATLRSYAQNAAGKHGIRGSGKQTISFQ
jgi:hypothetical protein